MTIEDWIARADKHLRELSEGIATGKIRRGHPKPSALLAEDVKLVNDFIALSVVDRLHAVRALVDHSDRADGEALEAWVTRVSVLHVRVDILLREWGRYEKAADA